ncbi:hypothetical protein LTV02_05000 [Nocardia yamanashiensis]|uniref:hypothetical protein n=1 Tax=Nocardia yamanashiensis TaxID=209247 RepID=UPI001E472BFD|nr:hypothetical protein [Nocardia yamanashiensis]UGT42772.1 hypothetical protein LTV02_05000 [Nocardia yamanashiensis]
MKRLALVALLTALAGCATGSTPDPAPEWIAQPAPATGARILSITPTPDGLLLLGSVPSPDGRSPAAWTTTDGRQWKTLTLTPHSGYAFAAELISGSAGDRVIALGQAFGGAHFNPRMTVWSGGTSALEEFPQSFEQFGGPHAIGVSGAAAIGGTGLLVGAWDSSSGRYGTTVWRSADGVNWLRQADDPALSAAPGEVTGASGVTTGPDGFLIAGNSIRGTEYQPLRWTSPDGHTWQRIPLSGTGVASQSACDAAGCVTIGRTVGPRPQLLCWPTPSTSRSGPDAATLDIDQALLHSGRLIMATRMDGTAHLLTAARDCTGIRDLPLPVTAPKAILGTLPHHLLLATTDPDGDSRIWLSTPST